MRHMQGPLTVREVGAGLHWFAACLLIDASAVQDAPSGTIFHSHNSPYLIVGDDKAALVDTGAPHHRELIADGIAQILGDRPLDYVFPTHPEIPHAGNVGDLARRYPNLTVCGEVRDYHLYFPELANRLHPMSIGDSLELGGTKLVAVDAAIRDLPNSLWAYDERSQTLFVGDALGFSHEHEVGQCVLTSPELPHQPTAEQIGYLSVNALYWVRFRDLAPYFDAFDALASRYPVEAMGPAHGAFITDPASMVPAIKEGMQTSRVSVRELNGMNNTDLLE